MENPHPDGEKVGAIIGIDLGTTYSVVATIHAGIVTVMQNFEGTQTTPSVVFFPDEKCTLGKAIAGANAETSLIGHPERGVRFIKRLMGRKDAATNKKMMQRVGDTEYSPEQISSVILRKLVEDAERFLTEQDFDEQKVTDAVITVPAYFGPEERNATEEAARLAGLRVRALLPEPIAAAIDYAKNQGTALAGRTVFVYDLGGGTFDVTIMRIEQPQKDGPMVFWVLGKDGSIELGGSDWDRKLAEYVADDYAAQHEGDNPFDDIAAGDRLLIDCEKQKRHVSQMLGEEFVDIPCTYKGMPHTTRISREKFDELTQPLLNETLEKSSQLVERVFRGEQLAQTIATKLENETAGAPAKDNSGEWNQLVTQCVAAGETLKHQAADGQPAPSTTIKFHYNGEAHQQNVTPADFEQLVQDGDNPWLLINEALLVGGSTKMKSVQEQLQALSGIAPRRHGGVDYNVARGAAIIAFTPEAWSDQTGLDAPQPAASGDGASTSSDGGKTLREKLVARKGDGKITPFVFMDTVTEGVGIEIHDLEAGRDRNFILIPANTTAGTEYTESFGIARDGQTGVDVIIYKGNTELLDQVRKLGMVQIAGLPVTTRAGEEVRIGLMVDGNGLVKGTATHLISNRKVDIEVKYNFEG